MTNKSNSQQNR